MCIQVFCLITFPWCYSPYWVLNSITISAHSVFLLLFPRRCIWFLYHPAILALVYQISFSHEVCYWNQFNHPVITHSESFLSQFILSYIWVFEFTCARIFHIKIQSIIAGRSSWWIYIEETYFVIREKSNEKPGNENKISRYGREVWFLVKFISSFYNFVMCY